MDSLKMEFCWNMGVNERLYGCAYVGFINENFAHELSPHNCWIYFCGIWYLSYKFIFNRWTVHPYDTLEPKFKICRGDKIYIPENEKNLKWRCVKIKQQINTLVEKHVRFKFKPSDFNLLSFLFIFLYLFHGTQKIKLERWTKLRFHCIHHSETNLQSADMERITCRCYKTWLHLEPWKYYRVNCKYKSRCMHIHIWNIALKNNCGVISAFWLSVMNEDQSSLHMFKSA
jgi:hypothetical protein